MPLSITIRDESGEIAQVDVASGEDNALVVATRPLKTFTPTVKFFRNPDEGADMNKNVGFTGSPVGIHDGTDTSLWTASAVSGTWDFASTDEAHTGTKSIDGTATITGSIADFDRGSTLALSGYVAITGWIFITGWKVGTDLIIAASNGGIGVGDPVNINDYVDTLTLDAWQNFAIPLVDMNLQSSIIDAVDIENTHANNNFYLDDMQVEETGGNLVYTIEPDVGTWLHIDDVRLMAVDALVGTLGDGTMPALSWDQILGETLTNGMLFQRIHDDDPEEVHVFHSIADFLQRPNTELTTAISDGTDTMITLSRRYIEKPILKSENEDGMAITIQDDLTGLLRLRVSIEGAVEQR